MSWKGVLAIIIVVGLLCIGGLTVQSCKRNNLKCFGTSSEW